MHEFSKLTGIPRLHWDGVRDTGFKDLHDKRLALTSKLSVNMQIAFAKTCKHEFVMDRGYMSELVYSAHFGRPCFINQFSVERRLMKVATKFVFLHVEEKELRKRFERTPDMFVTVEDALTLQKLYEKFFAKSILPKKICIECAGKSPQKIAKEIIRRFKIKFNVGRGLNFNDNIKH
jgi:hypothetical protein